MEWISEYDKFLITGFLFLVGGVFFLIYKIEARKETDKELIKSLFIYLIMGRGILGVGVVFLIYALVGYFG